MKFKKMTFALTTVGIALGGMFIAAPASAATPGLVTIQKECAYLNGAHCTGWYPNNDTCKDIAHHGTDHQVATCLAWSGYGSRG
ncbi:hypothetical protein [Frigoribacterium sp. VKM Ac-2836]|uniref:hypothetical protein n=1 Tax=Frigoribacterium sp. VKM Ac-2836 TaxID=2739014 RepID=UPI0015663A68|nr:hypothetical protein [Frigoribacterium sp. VKM Ac-2836]NRD26911.1 hypothetical protein [Frigoribacterium sp. VKM Ac-2836]